MFFLLFITSIECRATYILLVYSELLLYALTPGTLVLLLLVDLCLYLLVKGTFFRSNWFCDSVGG